jgi:small subunit ribosomal protein S18
MSTTNKVTKESPKFKRKKRRPCPLTIDQVTALDHTDVDKLRRFVSDRGKILPRRNTGVSAKKQRIVVNAIKRARHLGLLSTCEE